MAKAVAIATAWEKHHAKAPAHSLWGQEQRDAACGGGWQGPARRSPRTSEHSAYGKRAPCTLIACRGLDTATSKPALRGQGNGHASGTQSQRGHPLAGGAERGDARTIRLLLWRLACSHTVPTTACFLSLAPCLPLPTLPPCAPHSSPLPRSLLSVTPATEQGLTATHHQAPSSWFQSH